MKWQNILKNVESQEQRLDKCCQKAKKQFKEYMENKIYHEEDDPSMRNMMAWGLEEALQSDCNEFRTYLDEFIDATIRRHDHFDNGLIIHRDPAISDEQFLSALDAEINLLQKIIDEWEDCELGALN